MLQTTVPLKLLPLIVVARCQPKVLMSELTLEIHVMLVRNNYFMIDCVYYLVYNPFDIDNLILFYE